MSQEVDDLVAAVKELSAAVSLAVAQLTAEAHDPAVVEGAANQVKSLAASLTAVLPAAPVAATPAAPATEPAPAPAVAT